MKIIFDNLGDFAAVNAAEQWCSDHGISVAPMQRSAPRALLLGDYTIAKWRDLTTAEREAVNGTMTGDMRNGPVVVSLPGDVSDYPEVKGA